MKIDRLVAMANEHSAAALLLEEAAGEIRLLAWLLGKATWTEPVPARGGMSRDRAARLAEQFPGLRIVFNDEILGEEAR